MVEVKDADLINYQEARRSLNELLRHKAGEEIRFLFRKNGNGNGEYVFIFQDWHLQKLGIGRNKFFDNDPWQIYIKIAKEFHANKTKR